MLTAIWKAGLVSTTLGMSACMAMGGGVRTTGDAMDDQPVRRAPSTPRPDPLIGIALSDSQRVRVDSIRAMFWREVIDMGGRSVGNADDFENLVRREQVDVRLVLTPEQRDIYDRHVAENSKRKREPEPEPDH
jgi:hypothetical protein